VVATQNSFDALPMLGRGKHRNPKRGACFMELASFLAGERWSDHPQCTHPLLAMLARAVNDLTSDEGRPRLAPLIPLVIGLTSEDPRWDVRIALRAARTAIPVSPADRQQTLAVAIIGCERILDELEGRPEGTWERESVETLTSVPRTAEWARKFCAGTQVKPKRFVHDAAPSVVSTAVQGISEALVPDTDARLRSLLEETIAEARVWAGRSDEDTAPLTPQAWAPVVKPVVARA